MNDGKINRINISLDEIGLAIASTILFLSKKCTKTLAVCDFFYTFAGNNDNLRKRPYNNTDLK